MLGRRHAKGAASGERRTALTGWGRTGASVARLVQPHDVPGATAAILTAGWRGATPRGLGRAYGDAAQNGGGLVVDATAIDFVGPIDEDGRVLVAGGANLESVIRASIAEGWFLPVTPGTRHITIGGAFAADVHGKNHHRDGSFAQHVESITLLLPSGETREVTPESDAALFWATAGGMGLTGVILEAVVRLTRAPTRFITVDTYRTRDLDHTMALMTEYDARTHYSVAWIDLVTSGASLGRGVVTCGDHAPLDALEGHSREDARRWKPRAAPPVPPVFPAQIVNRLTSRLFNELWFRKAPSERLGELQPLEAFFYPLDIVAQWNRVYGSRGFLQWQCVLPFGQEARLRRIVEAFVGGPVPATLAVLKRFGAASPGPLSFPAPGWTLAVDLPAARGDALAAFLDGLDREVAEGGGRIYLAKDARMRPEWLEVMYPRIDEWRAVQARVDPEGRMTSDLDRRLGLTAHASARVRGTANRTMGDTR
jgi:decaprenylphospho-beta-D-ribofuranose 2-oxidase